MNKYEELLNAIRTNYGTHSEYYKTTKELVGKATPKKPMKIKTDYMESYVCPNCRHSFEGFSYCRFCGQALDRSNEDD